MEPAPDAADDLAGQSLVGGLGTYAVLRALGAGGMGSVHLARSSAEGAEVVVKVPHADLARRHGFLERFAREVRRLQELRHPHVVPILDAGEHGGRPFLVLPYLAGGSLEDRLRARDGGRLAPGEALEWLLPVAATLDHVHASGVVHRDVKPANLLFDGAGTAYLSDFGIARTVAGGETSLTSTGVGVGSPDHMAPEQATGAALDGRADQYSLASTLFQALAGRPPFEGDTPLAVLVRKQMDLAPTVTQALPDLPPGAALALVRALAKEPLVRFPSCTAFATAFTRGLHGDPPPPEPPPPRTRVRPRLAWVGGGALVAALGAWGLLAARESPAPSEADPGPALAPEQRAEAERLGVPAWFDNGLGMRFVLVPAGTFRMGAGPEEKNGDARDTPHEVTLSRAFYLQTTEVTNAQFRRFRPTHDSGKAAGRTLDGDTQPVTLVHHGDAQEFAQWVNGQDPAHAYRLPTESEWERAVRAGTRSSWWWGEDLSAMPRYANFGDRQGFRMAGFGNVHVLMEDGFVVSAPVGSFQPNPWGLYDLLGNVWECVADVYAPYPKGPVTDPKGPRQGASRVYRGAAYRHVPEMLRPSTRFFGDPLHALDDAGLRLAADAPTLTPAR